jgi:hypothetical protein
VDKYVSDKYNRYEEIHGKMLEKGNQVEEDGITLVSRIHKTMFLKNETNLKNDWICGTPDLYEGKSIQEAHTIRDTKCSWSIFTFFRSKYKKLPDNYYWQGQGYMALTGAKKAVFHFCLINTPYHLVEAELRKESYRHPEANTPAWIANHVYDRETFDRYIEIRGIGIVGEEAMAVYHGFVPMELHERHHAIEVLRNEADIQRMYDRVQECRIWMDQNLYK